MSSVCENCLNEIKYHSSNTDSFSNKKFDIYFCNRCFIGKTNLDKDFDFTSYYPQNYYGQKYILIDQIIDESIDINFNDNSLSEIFFLSDYEQISRAFFNLIKNSIESIQEKANKSKDFNKKIDIEINKINDYINIIIIDNGLGFVSKNTKDIIKPFYTTKQKGSGLGLSIVN